MVKVKEADISRSVIANTSTEKLEGALNFINKLRELTAAEKLYDTYYKGISKALEYNQSDNIYYDFRFDGTVTGRLSCAAYTCNENKMGVSFHTLPRSPEDPNEVNIRKLFLPPVGWYFITADYKTMELRILAHLSQDKRMIEAINSGEDLHKITASLIYGVPVDRVTKFQRQVAKSASFLIVYGGGAWKLAKTVNIPEDEAVEVIEALKHAYPDVFTWQDQVKEFLIKNKYVVSLFGRRRNLLDIRSPAKAIQARCIRQAGNFVIQSSASEITSFALLDICKSLKSQKLLSRPVASVHDSIEVVSPKQDLIETLGIVKHRMTNYPYLQQCYGFKFSVPLDIDVEVGSSFGGGAPVEYNGFQVSNIQEVYKSIG